MRKAKTALMFTPIYPPTGGGASVYFGNLAQRISEDMDVKIVTSFKDYPTVEHGQNISLYRVFPVPEDDFTPLSSAFCTISTFFTLLYICKRYDVDVLHTHSTSYGTLSSGIVSELLSVPILYDCRDEGFKSTLLRLGYSPSFGYCSEPIRCKLQESNFPVSDMLELPVMNPPYITNYDWDGRSSQEFIILFVGTIRKQKGVNELVEAFALISEELSERKPILKIIGSGPDKEDIQHRINKEGLNDYVRTMGELSHRNTLSKMERADVLVLPSKKEGVPRVVVESLSIGLPVITTSVGGLDRIISDGENGIITGPSPEEISESVLTVIRDQTLQNSISSNNQHSHDWNTLIQRLETTYDQMVS